MTRIFDNESINPRGDLRVVRCPVCGRVLGRVYGRYGYGHVTFFMGTAKPREGGGPTHEQNKINLPPEPETLAHYVKQEMNPTCDCGQTFALLDLIGSAQYVLRTRRRSTKLVQRSGTV